jgi:hypothetical protein
MISLTGGTAWDRDASGIQVHASAHTTQIRVKGQKVLMKL